MFRFAHLARTAAAQASRRTYSSGAFTKEGYEASKETARCKLFGANARRVAPVVLGIAAVETWRKISLYIALPSVAIMSYVSTKDEMDHIHHLEHDPPTFTAYPYLRVRKRKFPYGDGDHTPFWNPLVNPDPEE
ncbi:Cytochrome c oxidase subunit 6A1, mitochondrial [Coemansia sp. Benny D115]|nr:Cytochrome c oxidase subunit 6A1, mitochondrial [Coemansia sp. Benny D115]